MYDFNRQLGDDLWSLVQPVPSPLVAAGRLGTLSASPAFHLQFADGRVLKGRHLRSAMEAERIEYILRCVNHPCFPQVLARHHTAILSDWIDGTPLTQVPLTPDLAHRCGALHGALHSVPLPPDNPYRPPTGRRTANGLRQGLDELVRAGLIEEGEARALLRLALDHAPATSAVGFVHSDFCSENIVRRESGDLRVVDNDTLTVDAMDYDLGRTWYRWPMSPSLRTAYLAGYDSVRSSHAFVTHFPHWAIAAALAGAVFRLHRRPHATHIPIGRLRLVLHHCTNSAATGEVLLRLCDSP
jgi:phosphotransferase family enzyme